MHRACIVCSSILCSVVLVFFFFDVAALLLHLFFLYYAVHVVVYWQVLEFRGVLSFIKNHLEFVFHCIRACVLLACGYGRWREQWVDSNPFEINKTSD